MESKRSHRRCKVKPVEVENDAKRPKNNRVGQEDELTDNFGADSQLKLKKNVSLFTTKSIFPIKTYRIKNEKETESDVDLTQFFQQCENDITEILTHWLGDFKSIKFNLKIFGLYVKTTEKEEKYKINKYFVAPYMTIYNVESIAKQLNQALNILIPLCAAFQDEDPDWTLENYQYLEMTVVKLEHTSYTVGLVPTPRSLQTRCTLINVKNNDDFCFKWSILAYIAYRKIKNCTFENHLAKQNAIAKLESHDHYQVSDISQDIIEYDMFILNFTGIKFPITRECISLFESNNKYISINIFEVDDDDDSLVVQTIKSKEIRSHSIDLLALRNEEKHLVHYAYMACKMKSNENNIIRDAKKCKKDVINPEEISKMKFTSFSKKISPPVVIFASIKKMANQKDEEPQACAALFYIVHQYNPDLNEICFFEGVDCIKRFGLQLKTKTSELFHKAWTPKNPIDALTECERNYQMNGSCCACEEKMTTNERKKLFNTFTGKYVGPIHKACKITYSLAEPFFPVIFDELSRSDIHLLITESGTDLKPIPSNKDFYGALSQEIRLPYRMKFELRFIDSNNLLDFSINKLAASMDTRHFKNLLTYFQGEEQSISNLTFPHGYLDNFSKLKEENLPDVNEFENSLNEEICADEVYNYAQDVWKRFHCKSLGAYLKTYSYMKINICILADVFEQFRCVCLRLYKLDPINYFDLPTMAWDAMLKLTKVELDLIEDPYKNEFFQSALRGSLVQFSPNLSIANNKYLENFDPNKPENFLSFFEAEGLFDWAMYQPLPLSDFEFLDSTQIARLDIRNISPDRKLGYMLEVDLKYPTNLQSRHKYLPFCPERNNSKIILDLTDKSNYVIHLKHLQQCLDHGLVLTKVHRVLSFYQSRWLKPYIEFNLNGKKLAQSEFESHFFKSMNKVVYERLMRSVENKYNVVFARHYSAGFRQRIARDNFHSVHIFGKNLVAIQSVNEISYSKSIFMGACLSELSKWLMYEHYYKFLSVKCPALKLLYIDTSMFVISSENDIYRIIKENPNCFDASNYNPKNIFSIVPSDKVNLGLLKDKNAGRIMTLFIGLKERKYSVLVE